MTFAERGGWWVIGQLALIGLYVVALIGTDPVDEGIGLGFAQITGIVAIVGAAVIGVWSLALLRRALTIYPAPLSDAELVARGPYRLVRHPIYLAVILGTIGFALAALSPFALLTALVFVPFFMAKSGHEEDLLVASYPEYRQYRSMVPHRLIPWVL